ncbi:unnamed protein product [Anisakis simplex]|uniref:CaMBD domain-containing protein n=1 Tax=Anisakis simplex TaxID=6269 RepID=A0A0M3JT79_ANISI|nr:unnamed protein product [Anisakis simplex]
MAGVRAGVAFGQERPKFAVYSSVTLPFRREHHPPLHDDHEPLTNRRKYDRVGSGYGFRFTDGETIKKRYQLRRKMVDLKLKVSDWCLYLALFGLILAIIDAETVALSATGEVCVCAMYPRSPLFIFIVFVLKVFIITSTILLDILLVIYHCIEAKLIDEIFDAIQISLIEMGTDYWRVGITLERLIKLLIELSICSICPVPGNENVFCKNTYNDIQKYTMKRVYGNKTLDDQHKYFEEISIEGIGTVDWPILGLNERYPHRVQIPIDVLLCLPMFLRLYIACRYFVLHSVQFQDPSTKAMASLNQISVDFAFVVRSQLTERPLSIITSTTAIFWVILAWMLTQCERYIHYGDIASSRHLIDFIWFEVVTFFSIGYGDVQVQTYCGRALAIITGVVGTLMSSLLIALVARQMQLSLAERRVNQVIAESQLSTQYRHSAARVLQSTWRALKQQHLMKTENGTAHRKAINRFRNEQRNLLTAITGFRKARWKLRMRLEYEDDYIAFKKSFTETQDRLSSVYKQQQNLRVQLNMLSTNVDKLSVMMSTQL